MQLTVFANDGDQSYYLEVDASMHLEDLVALISAEVSLMLKKTYRTQCPS